MVRTQVQLTEAQARALRRLAAERGVSMAELVRASVDELLATAGGERDWERALAAMGRYRGGAGDVSEQHDRDLEQAYGG